MDVQTDTERVRHSRKMVLEFLGSSVDLSTAPAAAGYIERYGADPARYGAGGRRPRTPASGTRTRPATTTRRPAPTPAAQTVAQPVKVDNDLYVRDYSKCILCYKCVEACGEDAQNTFAIAVAGRGFDARISTEQAVPLPDSACVYCGNCIGVCPTGALMFKSEHDMRAAGTWDESAQTVTETICPYCGVGCALELHVQDNAIVKVDVAAGLVGDRRPPLHQGPVRLPVRPEPRPSPRVAGRPARRALSRSRMQVAQVDPLVVGVDVEAVAAQEADERHAEPVGCLDREVRRGRDRGDDRDAGDRRLLDDLEADPAADHQDPVVERHRLREDLRADQLVERVVPADVLAQREQLAGRREQARRVEAAGLVERPLGGTEQVRQGEQHAARRRSGRRGWGRSGRRPRRARPCRRSRTTPSRRSAARRRRDASNGRARRTVTWSSGWFIVGRVAGLDPEDLRAVDQALGPQEARPRARPRSPGVRIVIATATGSWPGPAARISSGSSPTTRSPRNSRDAPRTATIRVVVTWRVGGGAARSRRSRSSW